MAIWSVYVAPSEAKILKRKIRKIAKKKRWSFSQAVSGIIREHLLNEGGGLSEEGGWASMASRSFFDGYSEKDSVYDRL